MKNVFLNVFLANESSGDRLLCMIPQPNVTLMYICFCSIYLIELYVCSYSIYLIDHAWTYRVDQARRQLDEVDGLLTRMAAIMDIDSQEKSRQELVQTVMADMWK